MLRCIWFGFSAESQQRTVHEVSHAITRAHRDDCHQRLHRTGGAAWRSGFTGNTGATGATGTKGNRGATGTAGSGGNTVVVVPKSN